MKKTLNISNYSRFLMILLIVSLASTIHAQNWTSVGSSFVEWNPHSSASKPVSLSADGSILAIGTSLESSNTAGRVSIYQWNGSEWVQMGNNIVGEERMDQFGVSVSLNSDGTIVAIGGFNNDGNGIDAGHVRIFEWNGTIWVQKGSDIDGEAAGDNFGVDVKLSADGTILAIGGQKNDGNGVDAGHVRIYKWNGTTWVQKGSDIDGEATGDYFGSALSLSSDGTIVAIGASYNDGNGIDAGHVQIYEWNGTEWVQKGNDIDGEAEGYNSGGAVSISSDGSIISIGSPCIGTLDSHGKVKVYKWNGSSWVQKGNDIRGDDILNNLGYATSLSADGNTLAVGTKIKTNPYWYIGQIRIYEWNGFWWVQKGDGIDGNENGSVYAYSLSLNADGTIFAMGSHGNYGPVDVYSCNSTETDVQTACDSYTWINGMTYTESNNTATYITSFGGCNITKKLNLTINKSTTGTDIQTAYDSYTWIDGVTYTESNNSATYTLTTVAGCDSLVTLNLTINEPTTTDVEVENNETLIDIEVYVSTNSTQDIARVYLGQYYGDILIELYDSKGLFINTIKTKNADVIDIDMKEYTPGVYYANIKIDRIYKSIKIFKE